VTHTHTHTHTHTCSETVSLVQTSRIKFCIKHVRKSGAISLVFKVFYFCNLPAFTFRNGIRVRLWQSAGNVISKTPETFTKYLHVLCAGVSNGHIFKERMTIHNNIWNQV